MSKTVLIVEDEKILQEAYQLILSTPGFTVFTADNGVEALAQLKKTKPDVMLLDLFMPVMDGQEVLRKIRKKIYPATKIIVYSNLSNNTIQAEVLAHGADKFVLKSSMSPAELVALVSANC